MSLRYFKRSVSALLALCLMVALFLPVGYTQPLSYSEEAIAVDAVKPITWGKRFEKNGVTYFPGQLTADFGTLEFAWKILPGETPVLVSFESMGSAEAPKLEIPLIIRKQTTDTTAIYKKIQPPANIPEPAKLLKIAVVATTDLFSVLPKTHAVIPLSPLLEAKTVQWDTPYKHKGILYVPGYVQAYSGMFSFMWKISPDGSTKLVTLDTSSGSEEPSQEHRLYTLPHPGFGTTTIFEEVLPLANSSEPPNLREIAIVNSSDLHAGLKLAQKK
jgi:hypothetical protein